MLWWNSPWSSDIKPWWPQRSTSWALEWSPAAGEPVTNPSRRDNLWIQSCWPEVYLSASDLKWVLFIRVCACLCAWVFQVAVGKRHRHSFQNKMSHSTAWTSQTASAFQRINVFSFSAQGGPADTNRLRAESAQQHWPAEVQKHTFRMRKTCIAWHTQH